VNTRTDGPEGELDLDRAFGRMLMMRRLDLGLTQSELAKRLNISQSLVSRVEKGLRCKCLRHTLLRRWVLELEYVSLGEVLSEVELIVYGSDPRQNAPAAIKEAC
jgi:predicted transcriptional regulator